MAPAGRYTTEPIHRRVSKGNLSCQSLISPWSKSIFYKTFPCTLLYAILCARRPLFPLSISICISISNSTSISLIFCWCHRPRLRPIRFWCPCHQAIRRCSAATMSKFRRRLFRRSLPRRSYGVYKTVLVPHCLIAICNCVDLSRGLSWWCTVWCFFLSLHHRTLAATESV